MARKPTEQSDTGAPVNAKKLEEHAAEIEQQTCVTKSEINMLVVELPKHDGNDDRQKAMREEINALYVRLGKEYDLWLKLSAQLLNFDKNVDKSRREGERISRAEAEEFFAQFMLSLNLGHEAAINALAQEAALCDAPEQFCANAAPMIRGCMTSALADAVLDGKLPAWSKL